jgi:large subunit ribosomal protein L23
MAKTEDKKVEDTSNKVAGGSKEPQSKDDFDAYEIIRAPLSTEKAIRSIEFDNKLTFIVHPRATKRDVKRAVEEMFKVTVTKVNIQNSFTGQKRAYVKLGGDSLASDVSADLGLI